MRVNNGLFPYLYGTGPIGARGPISPIGHTGPIGAKGEGPRPRVPGQALATGAWWVPVSAMVGALSVVGCAAPLAQWQVQPSYQVRHADPGAHWAFLRLGHEHQAKGQWDAALAAYRQAATAAPNEAQVLGALGVALVQKGHAVEGESVLRRAVALQPRDVQLLNNLGYALLLEGRSQEAAVWLRQAVEIQPNYTVAVRNLARTGQATAPAPAVGPAAAQEVPPQALQGIQAPALPQGQPLARLSVQSVVQLPSLAMVPTLAGGAGRAVVIGLGVPEAPAAPVLGAVADTEPRTPTAAPLQAEPAGAAVGVLSSFSLDAMRALRTAPTPRLEMGLAPLTRQAEPVDLRVLPVAAQPLPVAQQAAPAASTVLHGLRLEVLNGNGVTGLAAHLSENLERHGAVTRRVGNLRPFETPHTTVFVRAGQEAMGEQVAKLLPVKAQVRMQPGARMGGSDVRVVLGHDLREAMACGAAVPCGEPAGGPWRVAQAER